ASEDSSKPWVFLEPEEVLIQNLEMNLDLDVADEQILVLKHRDEVESPLSLVVVDFDPVINMYKRTWAYSTKATNVRTFSLSLSDVIGDHKLEIVCFGTDSEDRQTLSILWRSRSTEGPELVYTAVCEIVVAGSIEIVEQPRSEAYEAGMKDGESYTIVTREHTKDSGNILDIYKSTYFWDFKSRGYIKMQEEFIPGEKIAEARFSSLLQKEGEDFLHYFDGPWYNISSDTSGKEEETVLFFETAQNRLLLYTGNIQEIYRWEDITRSLKNRIFFQGMNELMPYVTNEVYIVMQSMDSISVTLRDIDSHSRIKTNNDIWTGDYVRLTDSSWRQLASNPGSNAQKSSVPQVDVIGQYVADDGSRLIFNKPHFSMFRNEVSEKGLFSLYTRGYDFMELRFLDNSNVPVRSELYRFEYQETKGLTEIVRTMILTPGRMTADGFSLSGEAPRRFEQIETLESDL
ncbi:MAG: pallilysin-related adhesin, partial [Spirochaetales bacterium]|nr:pallilysin-related adhesin [Spirochaetales bacterium]